MQGALPQHIIISEPIVKAARVARANSFLRCATGSVSAVNDVPPGFQTFPVTSGQASSTRAGLDQIPGQDETGTWPFPGVTARRLLPRTFGAGR